MRYEDEMLIDLLIDKGIAPNLNRRIKPSRHPYMKKVCKSLKKNDVGFTYFSETDTLVITQPESVLYQIAILPSLFGISAIVLVHDENNAEQNIQSVSETLDELLPPDIDYEILGVV
mgnify:CR=1 FL=1